MDTSRIYRDDCLRAMNDTVAFPDESVDMIYIDPPFFTGKKQEMIWENEIRSYNDRWRGGIREYIEYMEPRLRHCYRILKPTGTLYLQCDWHANSYLRIMLDKIFDTKAPRNEIIWFHDDTPGRPRHDFARKHDTIFRYTKSKTGYTFNDMAIRVPIKAESRERYRSPRVLSGHTYTGGISAEIGKIPEDVLKMPSVKQNSREAQGYRYQKPERLLRIFIAASSNPGDVVLDPMCGCGTTLEVAQKMGRKWIGIDEIATACDVVANRLRGIIPLTAGKVELVNMPQTADDLKELTPADFQNWIIRAMGGRSKLKKSGDGGIDGYLFDTTPVQVKQQEHVGQPAIRKFGADIEADGKKKGIIVAFSFANRTVKRELAYQRIEKDVEITLKTVKEVLDEE